MLGKNVGIICLVSKHERLLQPPKSLFYRPANIFPSTNGRSGQRRCSVRKGVLKSFAKFTRKHLRQSLFLNKAAAIRCVTLLTPFWLGFTHPNEMKLCPDLK